MPARLVLTLVALWLGLSGALWAITGELVAGVMMLGLIGLSHTVTVLIVDRVDLGLPTGTLSPGERQLLIRGAWLAVGVALIALVVAAATSEGTVLLVGAALPVLCGIVALGLMARRRAHTGEQR